VTDKHKVTIARANETFFLHTTIIHCLTSAENVDRSERVLGEAFGQVWFVAKKRNLL